MTTTAAHVTPNVPEPVLTSSTPVRSLLHTHSELIKFCIVGGVSFVVDNCVYFALAWTVLTDRPTSAKIFAICVATVVSYLLNSMWSFSHRRSDRKHREAALFFFISSLGVAINAAPLYLSRHLFGFNHDHWTFAWVGFWDFLFGSIIGMLGAMVFRWWAFRKFVFPE